MTSSKVFQNGYQLGISGKLIDKGYVNMHHMETYKLVMNSHVDCAVKISIDNDEIGMFSIKRNRDFILESLPGSGKLFTFIALDSVEAKDAGLTANEKLGLIEVIFIPTIPPLPTYDIDDNHELFKTFGGSQNVNSGGTSRSGGTGLTGNSNQQFSYTEMLNLDYDNCTALYLRLIKAEKVEPLSKYKITSSSSIPPLM